MRRSLIAANWKMNGQMSEVEMLLDGLLSAPITSTCDVVVCPPSLYLQKAQEKLAGSKIQLGAQNIHTATKGAFTGEISASMLTDFECNFVLVGHSERRELFAETDEFIADKFGSAQEQGLIPILCIGETLAQREAGETEQVILGQLNAVIERKGIQSLKQAVVAYEPVWAIGTGLTATPDQAQLVHSLIRQNVASQDQDIAAALRILYGGSVKAANAESLFAEEDIDGALVGGASLKAEEFISICLSAVQH